MAQQLIQSKLGDITVVKGELQDLKAILLHSRDTKNKLVIIEVPTSRYLKILSDYWALNAINVEGLLETYAERYDFYVLKNLDKNDNKYKILRKHNIRDIKGKCNECDCSHKRFINPNSGICYYREMHRDNYTTKIKLKEDERQESKQGVRRKDGGTHGERWGD